MSCVCDGEPADIWDEKVRKARKVWTCDECLEEIQKGEEYTSISYLADGYWTSIQLCEYCKHDWAQLEKLGHCMEVGTLKEAWKEQWE